MVEVNILEKISEPDTRFNFRYDTMPKAFNVESRVIVSPLKLSSTLNCCSFSAQAAQK